MSTTADPPRQGTASTALAGDRLGVPSVIFFVMSAAAPLTVVAGVLSTGYAVTGVTGIPAAFPIIAVILGLFSVGYVAMARYVANAGAFYAYVARGLGRSLGVGAAWVALVAYNVLQIGLYGAIGPAVSPLLRQWTGLDVPWWAVALVSWALVAILGLLRVDVNGRVLAVLLIAEIAVILVYDAANLSASHGPGLGLGVLNPATLLTGGAGAVLVIALTAFVGFESSVVFAEESRNPRRTVPAATYLSVTVIAVLYTLSAWAMTVPVGPAAIVRRARAEGPELLFHLAGENLGAVAADIGHVLFATSIGAAMISFHNTSARYLFALGRERVLPRVFSRTSARTGAPRVASAAQSTLGLAVIVFYAVMGLDPLVQLFFWAGAIGGFGVLLLVTTTSIAVVAFFARNPSGENAWRRVIAPVLAALALLVIVVLAVINFDVLLGVPAGDPLTRIMPGSVVVVALLGTLWGAFLRVRRPEVHELIGRGGGSRAATGERSGR
ncbi:APC family permease [Streptosporangium sp. NPDC051022]|uniref:APC family permease n=1 Tax=Streptosporangium sp. NPDC051022 TaxID=3155752 RepID=UPI0034124C9B